MKDLNYNQKEKSLIEQVHLVFPKVELDPEVAIGALQCDGEVFINNGVPEPLAMEGFFRGVYEGEFIRAWEIDNTVFWPSQTKPIPWWEVKFENFDFRGTMDNMAWMSPYGVFYYFPFFMLVGIHDSSVDRQKLDWNKHLLEDDVLKCLTPPIELEEKDCWAEAMKIDPLHKNPLNKKDLYGMEESLKFLIFISPFNQDQKNLISEFVRYLLEIEYATTSNFGQGESEKKEIERLKSCWSFS